MPRPKKIRSPKPVQEAAGVHPHFGDRCSLPVDCRKTGGVSISHIGAPLDPAYVKARAQTAAAYCPHIHLTVLESNVINWAKALIRSETKPERLHAARMLARAVERLM